MLKDIREFSRQMRLDKAFRQKMLAAWKDGDLSEALLAEGYGFSLDELDRSVPLVRTNIRAGSYSGKSYCACGP